MKKERKNLRGTRDRGKERGDGGGGAENLIDRCGDCSGHTRAMREGE